jgi:hypothetical protein
MHQMRTVVLGMSTFGIERSGDDGQTIVWTQGATDLSPMIRIRALP